VSRICIPYATSEGQTERIAEYISDLVRHHGHEAEPMDIRGPRPWTSAATTASSSGRQYGFLTRHLMKRIAGSKPGELGTDTSRDYVYTEWDGVRRFTEDFLDEVVPDTGAG
jgi:menaquinone-dependent protoporphyrinogen IX oxidase